MAAGAVALPYPPGIEPPVAVEPTAVPVGPIPAPVGPIAVPVDPTAVPIGPTGEPVEPTGVPIGPADVPVGPLSVPVEPTGIPVDPTPAPVEPAGVPVDPTPGLVPVETALELGIGTKVLTAIEETGTDTAVASVVGSAIVEATVKTEVGWMGLAPRPGMLMGKQLEESG